MSTLWVSFRNSSLSRWCVLLPNDLSLHSQPLGQVVSSAREQRPLFLVGFHPQQRKARYAKENLMPFYNNTELKSYLMEIRTASFNMSTNELATPLSANTVSSGGQLKFASRLVFIENPSIPPLQNQVHSISYHMPSAEIHLWWVIGFNCAWGVITTMKTLRGGNRERSKSS